MWQLFHRGAELDAAGREALLSHECAEDPGLRAELESLLEAHDGPVPEVDQRAGVDGMSPGGELDELEGGRVGPYLVGPRLGEGGMGTVYAAEQLEPIRRQVALKVIRGGMGTRAVVARFEAERQALALMTHPNIARIHDAGATDDGLPYFVMERVDGLPITDHCDRLGHDTRQRLELFLPVCDAVQHAHHKGIIHRDIKPSNVMVVATEAGPLVKVIDFGIATAVDREALGWPELTQHRAAIGTPAYMSPEQLDRGVGVDTRADVYSLGALLYRLLAGSPPIDVDDVGLAEAERRVREDTPPTPSARAGRTAVDASRHGRDPRRLRRELRGPLDWIVMKALERDRERRYPTPSALAADIRAFLRDEPVAAGPPSTAYRLRTFVRRHRLAVAAAGAVGASLVLGLAGTLWMALDAARARDAARVEAETARAVSAFMTDVLASPDPHRSGGGTPAREARVVDVLDRAAERLRTDLGDRPEVRATLLQTLGTTSMNLALYDRARDELEAAFALRRAALGPDHPNTLESANTLAALASREGRVDDALALLEPTLEARRRVLGGDHLDVLESLNNLAELRLAQGDAEQAEGLFREAKAGFERALGPDHERTITAASNLGFVLHRRGAVDEAERLYREALAANRRVLGPQHPNTISALNNLASMLTARGRFDEAAQAFEEALALSLRVHGERDPGTLNIMSNLGAVRIRQGRLDRAEVRLREALAGYRELLGPAHPRSLVAASNLARNLAELGRPQEAEFLYLEVLPLAERALPAGDPNLSVYRSGFGDVLTRLGRHDEAEATLAEALRGLLELLGPDDPRTRTTEARLAAAVEARGRAVGGHRAGVQPAGGEE